MSGKPTIRQDIQQVRQNNPDTIASYGELADNSMSWGNAINGSIIMKDKNSIIVDDGVFDENIFSKAFCKNREFDDQHYDTKKGELGKYNFGLTDGVTLLGSQSVMIHKFGPDDFRKTIFDERAAIRKNNYDENSKAATPEEIEYFNKWQIRNNNEYDIKLGRGTILTISNLNKKNKNNDFEELSHFMQGLYSDECHNKSEWQLMNKIDPEKTDTVKILYNDLLFDCLPVFNKCIYVYRNDSVDEENIFTDKKKDKNELYKFTIKACFFEKEHIIEEQKLFGVTNGSFRVGFQVRRGGRLLTGIEPKLWGLSLGMNHGKGLRVFVDLPVNSECDQDWCVTTFKKITDDTWKHFNPNLQGFLKNEFADLIKLEEKDRKNKQKGFQNIYENKLYDLDNLDTIEKLKKELKFTQNLMQQILTDDDDKRLIKKNSNSYRSINNYINALTKKIDLLTPEPEIITLEPGPEIITFGPEPEPGRFNTFEPEPEPEIITFEPEPEIITFEPEPEPQPEPKPEPEIITLEPEPEPEPEPEIITFEPEPEPEPEPEQEPEPNYKDICNISIENFKSKINSRENESLENDKKLKKIIKLMNEC
jgi:hypothetical protein